MGSNLALFPVKREERYNKFAPIPHIRGVKEPEITTVVISYEQGGQL